MKSTTYLDRGRGGDLQDLDHGGVLVGREVVAWTTKGRQDFPARVGKGLATRDWEQLAHSRCDSPKKSIQL